MSDAITIRGVRKTFGPKIAVDNLDLSVPAGEVTGFIGPNGAGKTTTIRMIMSILFPDEGEISVLGRASAMESKDRIGYLPEERGVYKKMKVGPFIEYIAKLKGVSGAGLTRSVHEWLERVGLKDCYKKKCEELSKGMSQKVQFVSAVIHQPDLIILDEPFSGLDPTNRKLLRELIDEQHKRGCTIIFSTHAMYEAEQLCDKLFMIHRGKKVLDMALEDVWKRYDPRIISVEPLDKQPAGLEESWKAWPGVRDVHANPRGYEIRLAENGDVGGIIESIARIVRCRKIELKRPNLEDIFIQLTGGDVETIADIEASKAADAQRAEVANV